MHFAGEAGLVYGATPGTTGGCRALGTEVMFSTGASGQFRKRDWYAAVNTSVRRHGQGCQLQKLDFVYASEMIDKWYLVSKVFVERGNRGQHSDAVETALLFRLNHTDLAIAYHQEFSGFFDDQGLRVSVAWRY